MVEIKDGQHRLQNGSYNVFDRRALKRDAKLLLNRRMGSRFIKMQAAKMAEKTKERSVEIGCNTLRGVRRICFPAVHCTAVTGSSLLQ